MNLTSIDVSKCTREEKEVIEGFCLSYDLVRGLCLETLQACEVAADNNEPPVE